MPGSTRLTLKIALSAALAVAALAAIPATAPASIQLGAYTPGAPASAEALSDYAAMVGRQPDIVMYYRDFGLPLLYSNEAANLSASGQTPLVSWEPQEPLAEIAAGSKDSYLHEEAAAAKSWGRPLMIRFGHEMNGTWYSWAGSPDDFIAAWRHVVSVFREDGVTNVSWVWSPNIQEGSKYPLAPYFPGDEWVDYVGLDGYNWGTGVSWGSWESLQSVFAASYAIVTQLSTKPVIITETSSSEAGGEKAAWIRDAYLSAIPQSFPRVSAVVWFNKVQEDNWRIDSSQASLDAYRAVVACTLYGGTTPCEAGDEGQGVGPKRGKRLVLHSVRVPPQVREGAPATASFDLTRGARVRIKIVPRRGAAGRRFAIRRHGREGHNRIAFARLLRRHNLRSGRYRVVVIARSDGHRAPARRAGFRLL